MERCQCYGCGRWTCGADSLFCGKCRENKAQAYDYIRIRNKKEEDEAIEHYLTNRTDNERREEAKL
jgi:hypothetical protein